MGRTRVGVIGCGYWGPHLVRNLHEIGEVELLAVSDPQPQRLEYVASRYPGVQLFTDHRQLLASDLDAVVIATPIHTHYSLARDALMAGKDVLVEKPMATSVFEGAELVRLAREGGRVLMAGHTFVAAQARDHRFHVTIATVPRELPLADAAVVDRLRQQPELLSACYHGCDHDGYEFYLTAPSRMRYPSRPLAEQRADVWRAVALAAYLGRGGTLYVDGLDERSNLALPALGEQLGIALVDRVERE